MSTRGRQAEAARNDRLLLDAAREVFAAQGAGAAVAAIAGRAGVGIGSLYRRYATKQELQQQLCVLAMEQAIEAAERGLAADDAWAGLAGYIRDCVAFGTGALAPLAGQIPVSERMWQTARRGSQLAGRLVARAHQAGVLRPDVTALDISLLMELFSRRSPIRAAGQDQAHRQRLLAIALDGLRAPARQSLPGQPPSQQEYEAPWHAG
ncbi:MAG TPA: TetR family transcriptional regulator [Streptosporangiaceae bacterium]|nr:TetR family transcriptional regulator [Streptosporangiaceae bacterium]